MDINEDERARIEGMLKRAEGRCMICLEEFVCSKKSDEVTEDQSEN